MKKNEDREKVMEEVDKIRAKAVYSHSSDDCSDACKARGKKFNSHSQYYIGKFKKVFPDLSVRLKFNYVKQKERRQYFVGFNRSQFINLN